LLDYDDNVKTLEDLGLTLSQAKVYVNAAKLGKAKARDLWEKSGVGRQEIYRILDELLKMGLIEKQISSPSRFQAVPISTGALMLLNRKHEGILKLETEARKLIREKETKEGVEEQGSEFFILHRKYVMQNRGEDSYANAEKSVEFFAPFKRLAGCFTYDIDVYRKAVERGVDMRAITEKVAPYKYARLQKKASALFSKRNFSLRIAIPFDKVAFSIIDDREAYFPLDPEKSLFEDQSLWTNNRFLIALAHKYFSMIWDRAIEPKR
jgi:sugar-specific transcriptional regulator TrmB